MANYANLLATIAANIYTNGNQEVTAAMAKAALDSMVGSLGVGFQFAGVATPETNPNTPDQRVFYLAGPGTYPNFGGLEIGANRLGVLRWDEEWTAEVIEGVGGAEQWIEVDQNGFYIIDEQLNIGFRVDKDGAAGVGIVKFSIE